MSQRNVGSTGYGGSTLQDSLAAGRQQYPSEQTIAYSPIVENLRRVVLNPQNEITQRRSAYAALQRSGEQGAAVLKEFSALGLTLEEPAVVSPRSPKHPLGTVTGAID